MTALAPGSRIGPYSVMTRLGAGGMGEVYRARDMKLNRDVAIKVLLPAVANDPDRLARFSREAQVLASLNHPNIAHIHGLEESNGVTALVMELVEGEDLSQRISRGAIPIDEALAIARQIAEALEAAHECGIIHRDLKPANIKLRADGTVKVLDFGLAKAIDPNAASNFSAMNSPTLSVHATQAGIILGTAAYMSPEQARGRSVDKRTDIWAFGCVLFEMLAGARAFSGDDATDTIIAVCSKEPDWSALPASVSPPIRRLLRRCIEKDPKRRLDSAAAVRIDIDDASAGPPLADVAVVQPSNVPRSSWLRVPPWALAGALSLMSIAAWAPWRIATVAPAPLLRLSAELGDGIGLAIGPGDATTLSPDGQTIAFVGQPSGTGNPLLYVRRLTELNASPMIGTDDAFSPFFSPDGEWIAFFASGQLRKVPVIGGTPIVLCEAPSPRGGAWSDDGTIVFQPNVAGALMQVASSGGRPTPLTALAEGESTHRWPQMLRGGKAVLYTANLTVFGGVANNGYDDARLVVQSLPSGPRTIILRAGYHGRYVSSGHLAYIHDGDLFAAPFDIDRLTVAGPAVRALEHVRSSTITGGAEFHIAANGTLVYLPGQGVGGQRPIHWMEREGKTTLLRPTAANWYSPMFAPDGRRLALQINGGQDDIWIYEWMRDTLTRLTFDGGSDQKPVWTPDGRRLTFASNRDNKSTFNLYWQRADGSDNPHRLTESTQSQLPSSWHPSGKYLAFDEQFPQAGADLMILPMEGTEATGWKPGTPTAFFKSPFNERDPVFSPDGRWIAYISNESGRNEVYVRPFPGPGGKWQISAGGASNVVWSKTTGEIYFVTPNGEMLVASGAADGNSFRAEKPRLWTNGHFAFAGVSRVFDLHPDGARFAMAPAAQMSDAKQEHVTFLFNFFDELRRVAPVATR
jgi:serine/threonine protein kinase/Tol biopolymer transport system component